MGLTMAAIVYSEAQPRFSGPGVDTSRISDIALSTTSAPANPMSRIAQLQAAAAAWTRPARDRDLDCLSKAVYYEARGESAAGQAAVAQVVLNRAHDPAYPKSVCAVVYQPASEGGCQFTFVCDGAMARPLEPVAWRRARMVAARALQGYVMTAVGRALNFHAADASADAKAGTPVARLGNHVFFTAAEHPLSIHGSPVRRLVQAEPATIEEGPGAAVAARRFTMALGDLGLFGKRETAAQPATESVASAAEVSTAASE
jgi:spore germination cell wall hydrolase CwlJ-like protein